MQKTRTDSNTVSFIHISDTHFGKNREYTRHGYQSWTCARDLVDVINKFPADIDFVIHTGDVTTNPDVEAYRLAAEELAKIRVPTYYTVGNHDLAADIRRFMSMGDCEFLSGEDLLTYRFGVRGIRFFVVDARAPDEQDPHGYLCDEQISVLRESLESNDEPFAMFVHFPAVPMGIPWIDSNALISNGGELHELLVKYRDRTRGVFYGHIHMPTQLYRDGILYTSASSTFANFMAVRGDPGIDVSHEPPGYNFVHMTPETTLVRHFTFPRPDSDV